MNGRDGLPDDGDYRCGLDRRSKRDTGTQTLIHSIAWLKHAIDRRLGVLEHAAFPDLFHHAGDGIPMAFLVEFPELEPQENRPLIRSAEKSTAQLYAGSSKMLPRISYTLPSWLWNLPVWPSCA